MQKIKYLLTLSLILLCFMEIGCTRPKVGAESVLLSEEIGKGIDADHAAYLNLLDMFFMEKRKDIDNYILTEFLPEYLDDFKQGLLDSDVDTNNYVSEYIDIIVREVLAYQKEVYAELDETRMELVSRANKTHTALTTANTGLTALLRSAYNVESAIDSFYLALHETTGQRLDLFKFESKLDEYLKATGSTAGKIEEIKEIIIDSL